MIKVAALIALVIATSASRVQAQAAPAQSPGPATAQSKPIVVTQTRKICRTEIPTGSMLSKRVCRTETEIVQEQADGRALLEDLAREQVNMETQRANQGR